MKLYTVGLQAEATIDVLADSPEEAIDQAKAVFSPDVVDYWTYAEVEHVTEPEK